MRKRVRLFAGLPLLVLTTSVAFAAPGQSPGAASTPPAPEQCGRAVVAGAVRSASRIRLCRRVRLVAALAAAGGLSKRAEGVIEVLHADGTSDTYRLEDFRRDAGKSRVYLVDGDVVSVR